MAVGDKGLIIQSFTAASAMSAASHQFIFVKLTSDSKVCPCDTLGTDKPIGVLQNRPGLGEIAEVAVLGLTKLRVGGTNLAVDAQVTTDASGRGRVITATSKDFVAGRVVFTDATANTGALCSALINTLNLARSGD